MKTLTRLYKLDLGIPVCKVQYEFDSTKVLELQFFYFYL